MDLTFLWYIILLVAILIGYLFASINVKRYKTSQLDIDPGIDIKIIFWLAFLVGTVLFPLSLYTLIKYALVKLSKRKLKGGNNDD